MEVLFSAWFQTASSWLFFLLGLLQEVEEVWGSFGLWFQVESLRGRGRSGFPGYSFLFSCLSFLDMGCQFSVSYSLRRHFFIALFVVLFVMGMGILYSSVFLQTGLGFTYPFLLASLWA